ncbi:MAG TPA: trehalase family glycosidase, partial [Chloroflexia bacterium]|nr:trehalase family glycosidase [Chloroflexia bacterium]
GESLLACVHPWETGTDNSPAFSFPIEATGRFVDESNLDMGAFERGDTVYVSESQRPTGRDYHAYFGLVALFKKLRYDQRAILAASPFVVQDVLFNSLFAASLRSLGDLQDRLAVIAAGARAEQLARRAEENRNVAGRVARAVRGKLWDQASRFFYAYDCKSGQHLPVRTVSGLVPLLSGVADSGQADHLCASIRDAEEFGLRYPLPSTAASEESFDPLRYWSGPSWPVTNWLVIRGLAERGSPLAKDLTVKTLDMIMEGLPLADGITAAEQLMELNSVGQDFTTPAPSQYKHGWLWDSAIVATAWPHIMQQPLVHQQSPLRPTAPRFWEYYHSETGAPLGSPDMTWSAAVLLNLVHGG